MGRSFSNIFLLKARDPATASIGREVRFEVKDRAELRELLEMPEDELGEGAIYELEAGGVRKIVQRYGLSFEPGSMPVELHPWHPNDDRPYRIHTGGLERRSRTARRNSSWLRRLAERLPH